MVKEGKEERAREMFTEYPDLEIVSHHRFLGGCIGASAGVEAYVKKKVATWVECVWAPGAGGGEVPSVCVRGFHHVAAKVSGNSSSD